MKQKIRINENQLRQIVTESVKRVLNEGIGDEYLDNFGKSVSRSKRFGNVKDLSSWSDEQFDGLNSTRKDMHKKGRGVKTKGSTKTRDWLRRQTEKGNPIIKYKKNPDEWMKKNLESVDESKIKKAIKESVKRILSEEFEMTPVRPYFGFPEEREVVEKLESMGWIPSLWNDINPREFGQEGSYIIMVGFFDYTYCVGHKYIKIGSLEQCRDIIQDIIENNRTDCQEFIEQVEDGITEFEGWDEENEDTECQISSLGFDILTPDGQSIVADARGQHDLDFIY